MEEKRKVKFYQLQQYCRYRNGIDCLHWNGACYCDDENKKECPFWQELEERQEK